MKKLLKRIKTLLIVKIQKSKLKRNNKKFNRFIY